MIAGEHIVDVRSNGRRIKNWTSYNISIDMLQAGDQFGLEIGPADPIGDEFGEVWKAVKPDALVEIYLDEVRILSGFIDDRSGESSPEGDRISISGRAKDARLIDESMPLVSFVGLTLDDLVGKICDPWFEKVAFSNAENRALTLGRGRGARGGRVFREPGLTIGRRPPRTYRKVEPGETRWAVLEYFLRENQLIAWTAADGKTMIVGRPNYDQEPTFSFFHGRAGSSRGVNGNCASFKITESTGERYSEIVAMGSSAGNAREYGERTTHRRGVAMNGPGLYGVGKDFEHRKVLLVPDDSILNDEQAQTRAEREMNERDARAHEVTLTVFGHSQSIGFGAVPTLYACDTMAQVESEVFGVRGSYLITSIQFRRDRSTGEITTLQLVPKGTILKV